METPYACIATTLDRNFSIIGGVARSQMKRCISTTSSMVELINYTSNSIFRKNPIQRVLPNPVTQYETGFGKTLHKGSACYLCNAHFLVAQDKICHNTCRTITVPVVYGDHKTPFLMTHPYYTSFCELPGAKEIFSNILWAMTSLVMRYDVITIVTHCCYTRCNIDS